MEKDRGMPTESEWLIMEAVWEIGDGATSAEIIRRIQESDDMTARTIRVLITLLLKKGLLAYTVDERDSRVYHYRALRTREECIREKSRRFVDHYFSGSETNAMAALLQSFSLTDEQIAELEDILEKSKGQDPNAAGGKG